MKKLPVAISPDEYIELIKNTKKDKYKLAFMLGFESGLRISEIINLNPNNISLKEKKILVIQGKGKKDRIVPLPKNFRQKHLEMLPMMYKSIISGSRSLQIGFRKAAERSGLLKIKPAIHFHSLRHGFASNAVSKGIPIHHVRTLMGHTNISTTNVYLELNPKAALESYEELF